MNDNPASNPIVLIAAVGRTDLQVLVREIKTGKLYGSDVKRGMRAFHTDLLAGNRKYIVNPDSVPQMVAGDKPFLIRDQDTGLLRPDEEFKDTYEIVKENENLILVPAKLVEVLSALELQNYKIQGAILFNTDRTDPTLGSIHQAEPFACGPILGKWLAYRLHLSFGENAIIPDRVEPYQVQYVNYLDGSMKSPGTGRDYPINRRGAQRVDVAIRTAGQWQAKKRELFSACVSVGGGIPDFKDVIRASADFHFHGRVFYLQDPEFGDTKTVFINKIPPTPVESLRARHHAVQLIRSGDFTGAYAAVKHLDNNPADQWWIIKIRYAADYMIGLLSEEEKLPDYLAHLIIPRTPRCLTVGMRVEAALWAGRIPEAISWTCTFFDAALLDFIAESQKPATLDDMHKTIKYPCGMIPDSRLTSPASGRTKYSCLSNDYNDVYTYFIGGDCNKVWLDVLDSTALRHFDAALYPANKKKSDWIPSKLRNILMHGHAPRSVMEQAQQIFIDAGLWASQPPSQLGWYFLGQPMARDVLVELEVTDPEAKILYQQLVEGLCTDLAKAGSV
ncbi:MAG: hypothetical protein C4527_01680 [Candidatus Omnitrophota bacterium]|jgi:hypothetical protein|nr:MAG: hypothetical protein C4527_01680 [Candidatus Omnitrophota bacterium]